MIYRDEPKLPCPRCKTELVGLDICRCSCGIWVSAFAAPHVLRADELETIPTISWWRVREPCPLCGDKMQLRGSEPGLFQGCAVHGYWIDADTVSHTGLARGIDVAKLARLREDPGVVEAVEVETQRLAAERAARQNAVHESEVALERAFASAETRRDHDARQAREAERRTEQAQREATRVAENLRTRMIDALGVEAAGLLLRRIAELERRVAELERSRSDD